MNVLVIGLGSMGRRRIRLIQQYNKSYHIIGVDLNGQRRAKAKSEFGISVTHDLNSALVKEEANCAFICTSPLSHAEIIYECLSAGLHVFTELNLVDQKYDVNVKLAKQNSRVLFLSSTFLYRAEIKKINQLVQEQSENLNYTYHIGQYLPDWHPWESYKDFFVGDKRTNGCREIFAIELPWIVEVFGEIKDITVKKSKNSNLNLDYNDNYILILEHKTGHKGLLAVDVITRKAVRNLEVFGENLYLAWDGSAEGLKVLNLESKQLEDVLLYEKVDQQSQYSKFVVENAYYNEIEAFFEAIDNETNPIYSFEKDKNILSLIDEIEA